MTECPIQTRIVVDADGRWRLKLPDFWLRGGKQNHFQERRTKAGAKELVEIISDANTGRKVSERVLLGPLRQHWQWECFGDTENPVAWQRAVLIEADQLCQKARREQKREVMGNTAVLLARFGKQWFLEIQEKLSTAVPSGCLTFGQLAKNSPVTCNPRTLRRWLASEPWTERTKGGHCRVRLCSDFYWWYVKQYAADLARELVKKYPPGSDVIELTPEALKAHGNQEVGMRRSDLEDLIRLVAMHTHIGMGLEEMIKCKHPLLLKPLIKIPKKYFRMLKRVKGRDLEIAQTIGELVSKHEQPTPEAVAVLIGVSRATIYREPYRSLCKKWLTQLVGDEPVSKGKIRSKHSGKMKQTADADDRSLDELDAA